MDERNGKVSITRQSQPYRCRSDGKNEAKRVGEAGAATAKRA